VAATPILSSAMSWYEISDGPVSDFKGYLSGTQRLVNLTSRVGRYTLPGGEVFEYRVGDTAEFNKALKAFSLIHTATHDLILYDGPKRGFIGPYQTIDWTLSVCSARDHFPAVVAASRRRGIEHHHFAEICLYLSPQIETETREWRDPRNRRWEDITMPFTVGPGHITWDEVEVPANVRVIDKRGEPGPHPPTSTWHFPRRGFTIENQP
jgi:hypothetical protein